MLSFDDFKKVDLKIAQIEKVEDHPNADKLYVLSIKVGEFQKTIVAGIKKAYKPDELEGKKIVIVDNLEPVTIRGVESQGMLLAASDDQDISLVIPEKSIKSGAGIK